MPLIIAFGETEIHDYLRLDPGQDTVIVKTITDAAMDEAYTHLKHDFSSVVKNPDGTTSTTVNPAPTSVKEWVLNRIVEKYENRGNAKDPDFSAIDKYRKVSFGNFRNLNTVSETPETDAVNGLDQ
jgi:hypothetical protein